MVEHSVQKRFVILALLAGYLFFGLLLKEASSQTSNTDLSSNKSTATLGYSLDTQFQEQCLSKVINHLEHGRYRQALELLEALSENYPHPEYKALAKLTRKKVESYAWYDFQNQFALGWASNAKNK